MAVEGIQSANSIHAINLLTSGLFTANANFLTNHSMSIPRSIIGSNLRKVKKRLHIDSLTRLMEVGYKKLREAYTTECVYDNYIALSLIHEHRDVMGRSYTINGFNMQESQFLLDCHFTQ